MRVSNSLKVGRLFRAPITARRRPVVCKVIDTDTGQDVKMNVGWSLERDRLSECGAVGCSVTSVLRLHRFKGPKHPHVAWDLE